LASSYPKFYAWGLETGSYFLYVVKHEGYSRRKTFTPIITGNKNDTQAGLGPNWYTTLERLKEFKWPNLYEMFYECP
jgi:hypothetical protein